jgi:hypothetical protein
MVLNIFLMMLLFELKRVNNLPVLLHVHHGPPPVDRFIQRLIQMTNFRFAIIGPFALGIGVADQERQARTLSGSCPLQHLQVAVGVAECGDRTPADV